MTTEELVVRSRDGGASDAAFDYAVWGLRIGFEERPVVRPKERNAPLPSRTPDEALFAVRPELRATTPLARFAAMREGGTPGVQPLDLDRARALAAAIDAASPAIFAPAAPAQGRVTVAQPRRHRPPQRRGGGAGRRLRRPRPCPGERNARAGPTLPSRPSPPSLPAHYLPPSPSASRPATCSRPNRRGRARWPGRSRQPMPPWRGSSPASRARSFEGEAPLAFAGTIVRVKADATLAPIAVSDLLVSSSLPGHAMKAPGGAPAGTIVAKALEPLSTGTGAIRVLVMSR